MTTAAIAALLCLAAPPASAADLALPPGLESRVAESCSTADRRSWDHRRGCVDVAQQRGGALRTGVAQVVRAVVVRWREVGYHAVEAEQATVGLLPCAAAPAP